MAATEVLEKTSQAERRRLIASALADEIRRQGQGAGQQAPADTGDSSAQIIPVRGGLDIMGLAAAVERVVDAWQRGASPEAVEEGRPPQELNATNDD